MEGDSPQGNRADRLSFGDQLGDASPIFSVVDMATILVGGIPRSLDTHGVRIDASTAEHFSLFEDNPNQPTHRLASVGPFGTFGEIKKHPVSGQPLARELNKQVRLN